MKNFHLINWTMEVARDLTTSQTATAFSTESDIQDNAKPGQPQVSGVAAAIITQQPVAYVSNKSSEPELRASTITPQAVAAGLNPLVVSDLHVCASKAHHDRAIDLRWVLRDIAANRLNFSPVSKLDLQILVDRKLVEIRAGVPYLTNAGVSAII